MVKVKQLWMGPAQGKNQNVQLPDRKLGGQENHSFQHEVESSDLPLPMRIYIKRFVEGLPFIEMSTQPSLANLVRKASFLQYHGLARYKWNEQPDQKLAGEVHQKKNVMKIEFIFGEKKRIHSGRFFLI